MGCLQAKRYNCIHVGFSALMSTVNDGEQLLGANAASTSKPGYIITDKQHICTATAQTCPPAIPSSRRLLFVRAMGTNTSVDLLHIHQPPP
jgi:hypothetical protein